MGCWGAAGNWRLGGWDPYKPLLPSQGILGLGGEGACLAGILFFLGRELVCENLDDSIDDEKLRKEFSPYGVITSAR